MNDTAKTKIDNHWSKNPCGGKHAQAPVGTREYYEQVDAYRYGYYASWLPKVMGFSNAAGKKVLEIGPGHGADAAMFAKNGAVLTGIDLCTGHLELAKERFRLFELDGTFMLGDAENLPFEDERFDVVYSYGVIHHTPDIRRAIQEIHRVLKPGGEARIMIYARYSEFNLYVLSQGFLRLQFFRYGYAPTISHWYEGTAWDNAVPVGRYSKRQAKKMFEQAGFQSIGISKHLLTRGNVPILGRYMSESALESLAKLIGHNLIIKATK